MEPSPSPTPEEEVLGNINETGPPEELSLETPTAQESAQLNYSVSTDQADYAPESTVKISGNGYQPNQNLTIRVTWPDGSVRGSGNRLGETDSTVANDKGELSFDYLLTGGQYGAYKVEVLDANGTVLATTTFTDAPVSGCIDDSAGANDEPGQKDLTKMCVDYNGLPTSEAVTWNWDETGWTGNNSGDGCSLYDTDGDGLANYSLCVIVKNDPATFDSRVLYSCGDGSAFKCTNPISVIPSPSSSCSASVTGTDPFGAGEDYPNDTTANCTVQLSDFGSSSATLLDVCSYPSQQPNSDPSDCIVFKENTGRLEVVKDLIPSSDTGLFNLQINSNTEALNVGDGGTTGEKVLSVTGQSTDYTVGETAGTGTSLSSYSTTIVCRDLNGTGSIVAQTTGAGSLTVTLHDNDDIVCTITNTPNTGTLRVIKFVHSDNGGTAVPSSFNLHVKTGGVDVSGSPAAGSATGTVYTLPVGTYAVSEDTPPAGYTQAGFSGDCDASGSVTVVAGDEKTCTITNDDQPGTLIVKKVVTNDNGGTKTAVDFSFSVNGGSAVPFEADGQNDLTVNPGTYSVTEPAVTGYTTTDDNCTGLVIPNGGSATCTITNNDNEPSLTLVKSLTKDNGGTAVESDWTLAANGPTGFSGAGPSVSNGASFDTGTYDLSESGGPSGYAASDWVCTGGTQVDGDTVTVALGQTVTCTIINNDQPAHLIVIKHVDNTNGGDSVASNFEMTINGVTAQGGNSFPGQENPGTDKIVDPGTYNVTETGPEGYQSNFSTDCTGTIALGQTKTCTVTNDDKPATLTVIKHVINDNGGNAVAGDFMMNVTGTNVSSSSFSGSESGVSVTLDAGSYSVDEDSFGGYTKSLGANCSGSIAIGQSKTCIITNNDIASTITLIKEVINDNGGSAGPNSFGISVGGQSVTSGIPQAVDANTPIEINEAGLNGYSFVSITGDNKCPQALGGTVALDEGENITCTITNDDDAPSLTLVKVVITDNGGTAQPFDWTLTADGPTGFSGNGPIINNGSSFDAGTYTLSESGPEGYGASSWDCQGGSQNGNQITLNLGDSATCAITNDDEAPTLKLVKSVITDDGGQAGSNDWILSARTLCVIGDPSPSCGFSDSGDSTTFHPLTAGRIYNLWESGPSGYAIGSWSCNGGSLNGTRITLGLDEDVTCTITNDDIAPTLTLVKTVVNDNGGYAVADDFQAYIDGQPVPWGQPQTLNVGEYTTSEDPLTGYTPSVWSGNCASDGSVSLAEGDNKTCYITNDDVAGKIKIIKNTLGGDDTFGFTITGSTPLIPNITTSGNTGDTGFLTVNAGQYSVSETTTPPGWDLTNSFCDSGTPADFTVPNGGTVTCTFENTKRGTIGDFVWEDLNNDTIQDVGEPGIGGVVLNLYLDDGDGIFEPGGDDGSPVATQTTNGTGGYLFDNIVTGSYWVDVDGGVPAGYTLTTANDPLLVLLNPGENEDGADFGYQFITPALTISKSNNKTGVDLHPGDNVTFTITVEASKSAVSNVVVTDLPANGFLYKVGSWTASSNVRGDLKGLGITPEPTYASPGLWQLGNMVAGEIVTLTYITDIAGTQEPGLYKDLAWAKGISLASATVLALAVNPGFVDTNFVGTEVRVVKEQQPGTSVKLEHEEKEEVLGAATALPATGSQTALLIFAIAMLILGGSSIGLGLILRRKYA